jgi:hypothetical protein
MWQPASTAPYNQDLELAVFDRDGMNALVFPCRRTLVGWVKSGTREHVEISPTHWRPWGESDPAGNGRHAP